MPLGGLFRTSMGKSWAAKLSLGATAYLIVSELFMPVLTGWARLLGRKAECCTPTTPPDRRDPKTRCDAPASPMRGGPARGLRSGRRELPHRGRRPRSADRAAAARCEGARWEIRCTHAESRGCDARGCSAAPYPVAGPPASVARGRQNPAPSFEGQGAGLSLCDGRQTDAA